MMGRRHRARRHPRPATDALTPMNSFTAVHRGSLIHFTQTSNHSFSNHLWFQMQPTPAS